MKNIAYYLDYLYGLERRGIKIGLEHSFKLMEHLGNPQHSFQSIHVAGTNGKGSTCAHIASILKCAHYRVGLYTSPHLVNFNERIRVNGIPISDECIVEFISSTQKVLEKIEATFFEATTALALWYFDKTNVDVAVIETGLGGRLDSTNIIKSTQTIITQVAIDHSEILGNTIEKIAFEKISRKFFENSIFQKFGDFRDFEIFDFSENFRHFFENFQNLENRRKF